MTDLHVHTRFSCDSEAEPEQYVKAAIERGIEAICFTEHVDYNVCDYGYQYYSPDAFFQMYHALRKNTETEGAHVKLLAGIEFSEPHLYGEQLKALAAYPYDFVIGSIHWIGDRFPCKEVREQIPARDFFTAYWVEVLATVRHGGFDALGHIDFPKRYYGELYYQESILNEIFKNLIERDMCIEINTSSLRKGHAQTMPCHELLAMYRENGGKHVTIGSDAHEVKDLGADYDKAKALIQQHGLQEVIYVNRERVIIK